MKDAMVKSLVAECRRLAMNYSLPKTQRPNNVMNETYHLKRENIIVLGEKTAAVVFEKTREDAPGIQKAVALLFHVGHQGGTWLHLFVSYDHLNGMERVKDILYDIEQQNVQGLFERSREKPS